MRTRSLYLSAALLASACDDGARSEEPPATGTCRAFCDAFQDGDGCEELDKGVCRDECEGYMAQCPARAPELLGCLPGLSFTCVASEYAVAASGSPPPEPAFIESASGTLEIQDEACAATALAFQACEPIGPGPVEDCAAELSCAAPEVPDCTSGGCVAVVAVEAFDDVCADGRDQDANSFVDCADFHCSANPLVTVCGPRELTDEACSNGVDDDGNGYVDCADLHCQISLQVSVCPAERGAACSNGVDDDGDGVVDCADVSCRGSPFVACP